MFNSSINRFLLPSNIGGDQFISGGDELPVLNEIWNIIFLNRFAGTMRKPQNNNEKIASVNQNNSTKLLAQNKKYHPVHTSEISNTLGYFLWLPLNCFTCRITFRASQKAQTPDKPYHSPDTVGNRKYVPKLMSVLFYLDSATWDSEILISAVLCHSL